MRTRSLGAFAASHGTSAETRVYPPGVSAAPHAPPKLVIPISVAPEGPGSTSGPPLSPSQVSIPPAVTPAQSTELVSNSLP